MFHNDETKSRRNRRVRWLSVPCEAVLDLLPPGGARHGVRLTFPDLPADYEVLAVREDFYRRSFDLLVTHPLFPEVVDGLSPPGDEGAAGRDAAGVGEAAVAAGGVAPPAARTPGGHRGRSAETVR